MSKGFFVFFFIHSPSKVLPSILNEIKINEYRTIHASGTKYSLVILTCHFQAAVAQAIHTSSISSKDNDLYLQSLISSE